MFLHHDTVHLCRSTIPRHRNRSHCAGMTPSSPCCHGRLRLCFVYRSNTSPNLRLNPRPTFLSCSSRQDAVDHEYVEYRMHMPLHLGGIRGHAACTLLHALEPRPRVWILLRSEGGMCTVVLHALPAGWWLIKCR